MSKASQSISAQGSGSGEIAHADIVVAMPASNAIAEQPVRTAAFM